MRLKHWFYIAPLRLRTLFRRSQVEQELDEELRYHIERQIEEHVAKGMTEEEARYAALLAIRGVERRKEGRGDMRRARLIEDLMQDLLYGRRALCKSPGVTSVAALSLALGIGANSAIFSVVNAVLLRPLPDPQAGRLVMIEETGPGFGNVPLPVPDFNELVSHNQMLEQVAAYRSNELTLTGKGNPERLEGEWVSNNYFQLFGVSLLAGRPFAAEEHNAGHANVVII